MAIMTLFSLSLDYSDLRLRMLGLAQNFETCFFYDSNAEVQHFLPIQYHSYDFIMALGCKTHVKCNKGSVFEDVTTYQNKHRTWLFGFLAYDLKNETEVLTSENTDFLELPDFCFIEPEVVITVKLHQMKIYTLSDTYNATKIYEELLNSRIKEKPIAPRNAPIKQLTSKLQYEQVFNQIQKEIRYGNIYEINYCMAFQTELLHNSWEHLYIELNKVSQAPFSGFVKVQQAVIVCASPERFLKKEGKKLVSQPIKGTRKRAHKTEEDKRLKEELRNNPKEQSENVMITDLVRNDLSKHAERNTVQVEELFGVYSFKQVHQMISTVTAQLASTENYFKALKDAFPMGSMTGAPKVKAMQLIEEFEQMKRGLYSGAMGYINPECNYDFNVLIRSVIINAQSRKAQFCVGSAITAAAHCNEEYDECLTKARAMLDLFS